jgi:hypothetical protein
VFRKLRAFMGDDDTSVGPGGCLLGWAICLKIA